MSNNKQLNGEEKKCSVTIVRHFNSDIEEIKRRAVTPITGERVVDLAEAVENHIDKVRERDQQFLDKVLT